MSEHHSIAFEAMNELRKSEELCNFKIVVEGKTIQVHRVVLASCSEYFRKMFNIRMRECNEGVCQMKDTTAEVAEICVNFMYTGEMDVKPDVADEVLKLSHMWRLDKAVDICVEVMSKNLSSTNCVSILKLGKLYSLQTLTDNCIRYILWNISSILDEARDLDCSDMQDILKYSNSEGETLCTPWELWALYFMWSTSTHHDICEVMKSFPVEKLSYTDFVTSVWEDSHIWECEYCRKNVGERYTNSGPTITIENCLFLKHLENCYRVGPNTLTEFIVRESEKVFVQPEFESFTTEENLMEYISRFGEEEKECSRAEFAGIIAWLKFDDTRKVAYQKIFLTPDCNNLFLQSICNFNERIATVNDALFILMMCNKYSQFVARESAIKLIVEKFPDAVILPYFQNLTPTDLAMCLKNPNIYKANEKIIWKGIVKWVEFNIRERINEFPNIFAKLKLEKFSSQFLQQTVGKDAMVIGNKSCISLLLDFLFDKLHEYERKARDQDKRIKSNETRKRLSQTRDFGNYKSQKRCQKKVPFRT